MAVDRSDIAKIAGAVLGGIITLMGSLYAWRSERRRLRKALYSELAHNYDCLVFYSLDHKFSVQAAEDQLSLMRFSALKKAHEEPGIFAEIKEHQTIADVLHGMQITKERAVDDPEKFQRIISIHEYVRTMITEGKLKRRLARRYSKLLRSKFHSKLYKWLLLMYARVVVRLRAKND